MKKPRLTGGAFLLMEGASMECRFTFPNGKRCRCRATPSHVFCRQHAPQSPLLAARPRQNQSSSTSAGTLFFNWRELERNLITLEPREIAAEALYILNALLTDGSRGISDSNAGRLLRALLRRLGTVPFTLLNDPTPPPVPGYPVDPEAFERMMSILIRYAPFVPAAEPPFPLAPFPGQTQAITMGTPSRTPLPSVTAPQTATPIAPTAHPIPAR
jgi:hypothetical protein